jgi:hypothetical protein
MKRRRVGGFGTDSGDDAEPANAARMEAVRLEQAARARPRGLDAVSLSSAAAAAGGAGAADNLLSVPAAARSSAAAPGAAGKSEFGRGFAAAGSAADVAEGDDPQLAAFIAQKMAALRGGGGDGGGGGGAAAAATSAADAERALYALPPELRPVERTAREGAGEGGGMMLGGTGIAEVRRAARRGAPAGGPALMPPPPTLAPPASSLPAPRLQVLLPEQFQASNLAATDAAKKAFLDRRMGGVRGPAKVALALGADAAAVRALEGVGGGGGGRARAAAAAAAALAGGGGDADDGGGRHVIVGNLSSNFKMHGREFAARMRGDAAPELHPTAQRSGVGGADDSAIVADSGIGALVKAQAARPGGHGHGQGQGARRDGGGGGGGGAAAAAAAAAAPADGSAPPPAKSRVPKRAQATDDAAFRQFKRRELAFNRK